MAEKETGTIGRMVTNFLPVTKKKLEKVVADTKAGVEEAVTKAWENGFQEANQYRRIGEKIDIERKNFERYDIHSQQMLRMGYGLESTKTAPKADPDRYDVMVTERDRNFWLKEGYANVLETEQYDSREQTENDLQSAQDAAYTRTFVDPHFKAMLNNVTNYIIGDGLKFSVPNDKIQKFLEDYWKRNGLQLKQSKLVWSTMQLGEYFPAMFTNKDNGLVSLRNYRTYEIQDIEVAKNDRDKYLAYHYYPATGEFMSDGKWVADYRYFKQLEEDGINRAESEHHSELSEFETVLFFRHNMGDEVRGRVPFAGALKYLRMSRDFLFDRFILNHKRNRVIWVQKVSRRTTEKNIGYKPTPYDTALDDPMGEIIKVFAEDDIQAISANIDANDALPDYLSILYMAAAEAQVPLIVIDQRASEEVYASMKRSSNPFHQMIKASRTFFGYYFAELFRYAIEQGVKYGDLGKTVMINQYQPISSEESPATKLVRINTENIPILIQWPLVFSEDPINEARSDALMLDRGVMSPETAAAKRGLNYPEERAKMAQYPVMGMDDDDEDNADDKATPNNKKGPGGKPKDKGNGKPGKVRVGV